MALPKNMATMKGPGQPQVLASTGGPNSPAFAVSTGRDFSGKVIGGDEVHGNKAGRDFIENQYTRTGEPAEMRLTILGSGSDGNAALLRSEKTNLLIEGEAQFLPVLSGDIAVTKVTR